MKKLVLTFLILLACFQVEAQFYTGIKGGPNISFSNTTTNYWTSESFQNYKVRHTIGLVAGYHFVKQKFSVEIRYNDQYHARVMNFGKSPFYPDPPQIVIKHHGSAASLYFKAVLNNPEAKFKIRTMLGGSRYYPYPFLDHIKNPWRDHLNGYYYIFPYSPDKPEYFAIKTSGFDYVGNMKKIWLFHTGLEVETQLYKNINFSLGVEYQIGTRPVSLVNFEYTYNYQFQPGEQTGTVKEPFETGSVISRAEALNLNLELTYSFSKRKKQE
ncbi:hypothetical protein [Adhaeribacter terreus]|uniref:Outer membrane protein beta-barrel domain-containing protein n=1 Tax=Adhaeribacter terreus TaxID=529703 RepID=A0ABW0E4R2_9BACT